MYYTSKRPPGSHNDGHSKKKLGDHLGFWKKGQKADGHPTKKIGWPSWISEKRQKNTFFS